MSGGPLPNDPSSSGSIWRKCAEWLKRSASVGQGARALRGWAAAVFVVQDSFYKDIHNDLPTIISEMSGRHGFEQVRQQDFYIGRSMAGINPGARMYERRPGANEAVLCMHKT